MNIQNILENNIRYLLSVHSDPGTILNASHVRSNLIPTGNPTQEVILLSLFSKELSSSLACVCKTLGQVHGQVMYDYLRPPPGIWPQLLEHEPLTTASFHVWLVLTSFFSSFLPQLSILQIWQLPARGPLTNQRHFQSSTPALKTRKARSAQPTSCI